LTNLIIVFELICLSSIFCVITQAIFYLLIT